eukprot:215741_1
MSKWKNAKFEEFEVFSSPTFNAIGSEWYLEIYPNGKERQGEAYMYLYIEDKEIVCNSPFKHDDIQNKAQITICIKIWEKGSIEDRMMKMMRSKSSETIHNLEQEKKKLKFAIHCLQNTALNLPSARAHTIQWEKQLCFEHLTIRSSCLQAKKEMIQQQQKYAKLKHGEYLVENNPSNSNCSYSQQELDTIKSFIIENHVGNVNPIIQYQLGIRNTMDNVLGIRKTAKIKNFEILEGAKECYAKVNIDKGVILGQYIGNEMLKEEFDQVYNGTREEMHHMTYMFGDTVIIPDAERMNASKKRKLNNGKHCIEFEVYIDGIAADTSVPLLYINDGRVNMDVEPTVQDKRRINVEFVSILCNGWPYVMIRSTKKLNKGSIWVNYGCSYGFVMECKAIVEDAKQKQLRMVRQILRGVDLGDPNRFEIH